MDQLRWNGLLGCLALSLLLSGAGAAQPVSPATDAVAADPAAAADAAVKVPAWAFHPAAPEAALALRQSSWSQLRIMEVDARGWVRRSDGWMDNKDAGHYYRSAGALEALQGMRRGRSHRLQGILWTWAAPTLGGVLLALAGGETASIQYGTVNSAGGYNYSSDIIAQKIGQDALIGAGVGALLGAAVGLPLGLSNRHQADQDDRAAAESFNQKLLKDLRLQAQPLPGGARLGLEKGF